MSVQDANEQARWIEAVKSIHVVRERNQPMELAPSTYSALSSALENGDAYRAISAGCTCAQSKSDDCGDCFVCAAAGPLNSKNWLPCLMCGTARKPCPKLCFDLQRAVGISFDLGMCVEYHLVRRPEWLVNKMAGRMVCERKLAARAAICAVRVELDPAGPAGMSSGTFAVVSRMLQSSPAFASLAACTCAGKCLAACTCAGECRRCVVCSDEWPCLMCGSLYGWCWDECGNLQHALQTEFDLHLCVENGLVAAPSWYAALAATGHSPRMLTSRSADAGSASKRGAADPSALGVPSARAVAGADAGADAGAGAAAGAGAGDCDAAQAATVTVILRGREVSSLTPMSASAYHRMPAFCLTRVS